MIAYGFTRCGYQRYKCKKCHYTYTFHNHKNKKNKEKIWFEKWITEGYSFRQLSDQSGHSLSKIKRIAWCWLGQLPIERQNFSNNCYLLFDGTFIQGRKSIITVMDNNEHKIIAGQYDVAENSIPQLRYFFQPLIDKKLQPKSVTVDGNPQVIKLFRELWPKLIIQRCLAHVQRQGLMWCRRFPKRTDAKHLRKLFQRVTVIKTIKEKERFLSDIQIWEQKYGCYLIRAPERGKVFSDIKRARSMLLKALPDMFHYLDDPLIPSTTNSLEGYFSRLKANYRQHRGLSLQHRYSYFKWYFFLKNI